ncbi:hypothetical protein E6C27_scaffold753G00260 [Cucumis melo var. makuwa]|uniref:Uncharacterized protein n=1 Tax=Cucumis melo var. makuwa TaxID=1194695 RepID=A0A5A7V2Q5_CUCMM|nr:hypothetical protein E6C27_scaffold753G00260 [Cucumis melo var. makuwa]
MAARPSAVLSVLLVGLLLISVVNAHEGHAHPPSSEHHVAPPPQHNAAIVNSLSYFWSMAMAMVAASSTIFF